MPNLSADLLLYEPLYQLTTTTVTYYNAIAVLFNFCLAGTVLSKEIKWK